MLVWISSIVIPASQSPLLDGSTGQPYGTSRISLKAKDVKCYEAAGIVQELARPKSEPDSEVVRVNRTPKSTESLQFCAVSGINTAQMRSSSGREALDFQYPFLSQDQVIYDSFHLQPFSTFSTFCVECMLWMLCRMSVLASLFSLTTLANSLLQAIPSSCVRDLDVELDWVDDTTQWFIQQLWYCYT